MRGSVATTPSIVGGLSMAICVVLGGLLMTICVVLGVALPLPAATPPGSECRHVVRYLDHSGGLVETAVTRGRMDYDTYFNSLECTSHVVLPSPPPSKQRKRK